MKRYIFALTFGAACSFAAWSQSSARPDAAHQPAAAAHTPLPATGGLHAHTHGPAHIYEAYRAMRAGGVVIFMRHAKTHALGTDKIAAHEVNESNCDQQRTLSPAGKETAREIGRAWGFLKLPPVDKVEYSPYCRTKETAELAFGTNGFPLVLNRDLLASSGSMQQLGERLKTALAQVPAPGMNRVIVGHLFSPQMGLGMQLEEGEAVVAKPNGQGSYQVIARITSIQWGDLTRDVLAYGDRVFELSKSHGHHGAHSAHGPGGHTVPTHAHSPAQTHSHPASQR
ncbi:MAG: hypothetical protein ACKO1L_06060 [Brachymonas sp.]